MRHVSKHGLVTSPNPFGRKKSPIIISKVLETLRKGYTPKEAAESAGVSRTAIFDWKRNDPEFAAAWAAAVDEGTDVYEREAYRRGVEGYDRPVFQGGEEVGKTREYSDTLLVLSLRGRRPHVYNTDRHQHTGADGGPIQTQTEVTVKFVAATQQDDEE